MKKCFQSISALSLLLVADAQFTPSVNWSVELPGIVSSSNIHYDPETMMAWTVYNWIRQPFTLSSDPNEKDTRICPIDTVDGTRGACTDILASMQDSVGSRLLVSEACFPKNNKEQMDGIAIVTVESNAFNERLGSSIHYYSVLEQAFTAVYSFPGRVTVQYDGLDRPAFSSDCSRIFHSLTNNTSHQTDMTSSFALSTRRNEQIWESPFTPNRYVGFAVSSDDARLYAALNSHFDSGIVALDASNGLILEEYRLGSLPSAQNPVISWTPYIAWTNVVVDSSDNPYYIDDVLGLVKFNGRNLAGGPLWNVNIPTPNMAGSSESGNQGYHRPAFDPSGSFVFASEGYRTAAVELSSGASEWNTRHTEANSWAQTDIRWTPSVLANSGAAVCFSMRFSAQCNDAERGTLLFTYDGATNILPISDRLALVLNRPTGSIELINTAWTTLSPTSAPTFRPTASDATRAPTTLPPVSDPSSDSSLEANTPLPTPSAGDTTVTTDDLAAASNAVPSKAGLPILQTLGSMIVVTIVASLG